MNRVSLLELIRKGGDLDTTMSSPIHYPADGHERLSAIEKDHFWFTRRRDLVRRLLERYLADRRQPEDGTCPLRGIDLGCGSGYTAVWLSERGFPTCGQDVYRGFAAFKESGRALGFVQGDIMGVEPAAEFDFALLLDVIEHVPDDRAFVDHVGKLVKPGGIVVITVPAFRWLWSNVDDASGHLRRYVRRDMSSFQELPVSRFKVVFSSYYFGLTLPLYFVSRSLSRISGKAGTATPAGELAPSAFVNAVLEAALSLETKLCLSVGVPLGSSLITVLEKSFDPPPGASRPT